MRTSCPLTLLLAIVLASYDVISARQLSCNMPSGFYCDSINSPNGGYVFTMPCSSTDSRLIKHPFRCQGGTACEQSTPLGITCVHVNQWKPTAGGQVTNEKPTTTEITPTPYRQKHGGRQTPCGGYYCNNIVSEERGYFFTRCGSIQKTFTYMCPLGRTCVQTADKQIDCVKAAPTPKTTTTPAATTTTTEFVPTPYRSPGEGKVIDCSNSGSGYYCDSANPDRGYFIMFCPHSAAIPLKHRFKCSTGESCTQSTKTTILCKATGYSRVSQPSTKLSITGGRRKPTTTPHPKITLTKFKFPMSETPMLIFISSDDAITPEVYEQSMFLFNGRQNPNGCPVSATYNAIVRDTKFDLLKMLYDKGHEIASHSVTHRTPTDWWRKASKADWEEEIMGFIRVLQSRTGIPSTEVRGMRAPFLEVGSDNRAFEMMRENGLKYDSSIVPRDSPTWPYRLTVENLKKCGGRHGCPTKAFPSLWEVPLSKLYDCPMPGYETVGLAMVDQCSPETYEQALSFLKANFDRYYAQKVPLGLNMHFAWFSGVHRRYRLLAMKAFLDEMKTRSDVWIVSSYKVIQYLERPVSNQAMRAGGFPPVNC